LQKLHAAEPEAVAVESPRFTGIIYTADHAGKWSGKVKGHLPQVTVDAGKVTVFTDHSMSEEHFIVRHTVVSAAGEVLGEKTFSPKEAKAQSEFVLPEGASGTFYATSFCNKHDFWLTTFTI
jgi:superoxide reductase